MKAARITIEGKDCFSHTIDLIEKETGYSLKSNIIDGALYFIEKYSMMNNTNLMLVLKLQRTGDNSCFADIISGGGGEGWFSLTLGNERRKLDSIKNLLYEFCNRMKFSYTETKIETA